MSPVEICIIVFAGLGLVETTALLTWWFYTFFSERAS